ncbi:3-hydroxyacyl-CoA dehydrogenase [Zwartia sp.]|uniref:3-hydroxyacyl-CoA dehydrogenase n=1 Tax=Zwartia sp. TaxID=2978004 RepID=UPI003BB197AE
MNIAIVGSGLVGQAWAIVFARGGHRVKMWDGDPSAVAGAATLIEKQVADLQAAGLIDDPVGLIARISGCATLEEVLLGADYVQESLPERLEMKKEIFAKMDALAPSATILASSTSSIPASAFTEALPGRARCLIAHPVNPPYLVPVVEICGAPWTDAQVVQRTWDVMEGVGQKPVKIHRELKGFVLNRLQGALLREAFRLVEQGYVDAEGLDVTVREGLGLRWSFMGPFETIDLNAPDGLADYARRFNDMYQSISTEQTSTEPWSEAVIEKLESQRRTVLPKDQLLARRLWRDRRLMALAAHKKSAE